MMKYQHSVKYTNLSHKYTWYSIYNHYSNLSSLFIAYKHRISTLILPAAVASNCQKCKPFACCTGSHNQIKWIQSSVCNINVFTSFTIWWGHCSFSSGRIGWHGLLQHQNCQQWTEYTQQQMTKILYSIPAKKSMYKTY